MAQTWSQRGRSVWRERPLRWQARAIRGAAVALLMLGCRGAGRSSEADEGRSVANNLERFSTLQLFELSRASLDAGDLPAAARAFYCGGLRFERDSTMFLMLQHEKAAFVAVYRSIEAQLRGAIVPAVARNPDVLAKVIRQLEDWKPETPFDFNPGWRYHRRVSGSGPAQVQDKARYRLLDALEALHRLVTVDEYRACLLIVQQANESLQPRDPREVSGALQKMALIEERLGLRGVAAVSASARGTTEE